MKQSSVFFGLILLVVAFAGSALADDVASESPYAEISIVSFDEDSRTYTFSCDAYPDDLVALNPVYIWYFDVAGSTQTRSNIASQSYPSAGNYTVKCVVRFEDGLILSDFLDFTIQGPQSPPTNTNNQNSGGGSGGSSTSQEICFEGQTLRARGSTLRNYINQGATFGPCSIEELSNENNESGPITLGNDNKEETEAEEQGRAGITGAVVGSLKQPGVWGIIIFAIVVAGAYVGSKFMAPKAKK